MKKIIFILIPFIFWGCKRDFNSVIDTQPVNFQVTKINTVDSFTYQTSDSLMTLSIGFNSSQDINSVYANVFDSDMNQINLSPIILYDNGNIQDNSDTVKSDGIYSNKFPLSHYYPKGNYQIQFFVTDILNNNSLAAYHSFAFDNGQTNVAPVLSNLTMPDSTSFGKSFTFTVKAEDQNGLSDITSVYYQLYRPDGTLVVNSQGISEFPLSDNGDTGVTGDVTAHDGIFTNMLTIPSGQQTGTWKFVFQAKDRGGLLSNTISHNLVVK
ncbi:MAG: hypothetical protein M1480_18220 [Bacteroidetes bacterium]|nr:hypothetical protein [Bacteroidota bacterium]